MLAAIIAGLLVFLMFLAIVGTIAMVNKERKPITPGLAIATFVVQILMIVGVLYLWMA